jgi:hypothetical protein
MFNKNRKGLCVSHCGFSVSGVIATGRLILSASVSHCLTTQSL